MIFVFDILIYFITLFVYVSVFRYIFAQTWRESNLYFLPVFIALIIGIVKLTMSSFLILRDIRHLFNINRKRTYKIKSCPRNKKINKMTQITVCLFRGNIAILIIERSLN